MKHCHPRRGKTPLPSQSIEGKDIPNYSQHDGELTKPIRGMSGTGVPQTLNPRFSEGEGGLALKRRTDVQELSPIGENQLLRHSIRTTAPSEKPRPSNWVFSGGT